MRVEVGERKGQSVAKGMYMNLDFILRRCELVSER